MSSAGNATISALYRYPVKGLTPESMQTVAVSVGETLPLDRAYAIENGSGRFDPQAPRHLPKVNFLMLMRNERMATLTTHFDDDTHKLTIKRHGKSVSSGQLNTTTGRAIITQFLSAYFADDLRGAPHIVSAPNHSFSDVADKCLHIVNLASVRDLERVAGATLNPLRFRSNVVIDTNTPWQELDWVGKTLKVGGAELQVIERTQRCAAINVNPETGQRDMDLLTHLARNWNHTDFGLYAKVTWPGELAVNASLTCSAEDTIPDAGSNA